MGNNGLISTSGPMRANESHADTQETNKALYILIGIAILIIILGAAFWFYKSPQKSTFPQRQLISNAVNHISSALKHKKNKTIRVTKHIHVI